jgi:hypothetical protein
MATSISRPRIGIAWNTGFRRGRERNSTMQYLQSSPQEYERVMRIIHETRAAGFAPSPMPGVRQPFDYQRL